MTQSYGKHPPQVDPDARVAETAVVVGEVSVEAGASLWYGAVLRGDEAPIRVGRDSNIQDNAVVHCDAGFPAVIGSGVTVGHGAILHGCTVEDGALIGMGAVLLNGCVIGADSLVAAGALVTQGAVIPPGSLVVGSPARVKRPLRPDELAGLAQDAEKYLRLSAELLSLAGDAEGL